VTHDAGLLPASTLALIPRKEIAEEANMSVRDLIPWGRSSNPAPGIYRDIEQNPFLSFAPRGEPAI
jgi:hypothetical protein